MIDSVAYWDPAPVDMNFSPRPPDPGILSTYRAAGWEALYHSPFLGTGRMVENFMSRSEALAPAPEYNRLLDPDEAQRKYGMGGRLNFKGPIREQQAILMSRRKQDEIDREYFMSIGMTTGMRQVASIPVSMAATILDPINAASMFIPVVGEARFARMVKTFGGSVLKARLTRGAIEGTAGMAMVEPFILLPNLQDQANYSLRDSAVNLGFGAALGAFLHAGLGKISDRLKRVKVKDQDVAFEAALNDVLNDRPVTSPAEVVEIAPPETVVFPLNPRKAPGIGYTDKLGRPVTFDESIKNWRLAQLGEGPVVEGPYKETIIQAAIRLPSGKILQDANHPRIMMNHPELETIAGNLEEGFLTSSGRFVNREEATKIAFSSGQLEEQIRSGEIMAAEDLMLDPGTHGLAAEDVINQPYDIPEGPILEDITRHDLMTGKIKSVDDIIEAVKSGKLLVLWHGGEDVKHVPLFTTSDKRGANWFSRERGGETHQIVADIKNPLVVKDLESAKILAKIAEDAGIPVDIRTYPGGEWEWWAHVHGPEANPVNPLDVVFFPEVREALTKAGYDSLIASDTLENTEIPTVVLTKDPNQIVAYTKPRDPKTGRFLSNEQRLEMLKEQIRNGDISRDNIRDETIKELSSRTHPDVPPPAREVPREVTALDKEVADIEKFLELTPEERTAITEELADAGVDPVQVTQRERGVRAGINCIVNNLL